MKTRSAIAVVLLAGAIGCIGTASAKTIKANSRASAKAFSACDKNGGTSWPQTAGNPTYGCIDKNGKGLVCGGGTQEQKDTCSTFRSVPPRLLEVLIPEVRRLQKDEAAAP